mgnify:FL=1
MFACRETKKGELSRLGGLCVFFLCAERIAKITHDNRVLLKKMTEIMQKNQLDNFNTTKPRSLNKERRKRELMRITRENQVCVRVPVCVGFC